MPRLLFSIWITIHSIFTEYMPHIYSNHWPMNENQVCFLGDIHFFQCSYILHTLELCFTIHFNVKSSWLWGAIICFYSSFYASTPGCRLCSCNNFRTTVHSHSFGAGFMALTYRLPDWIFIGFVCDLNLGYLRSIFSKSPIKNNGVITSES